MIGLYPNDTCTADKPTHTNFLLLGEMMANMIYYTANAISHYKGNDYETIGDWELDDWYANMIVAVEKKDFEETDYEAQLSYQTPWSKRCPLIADHDTQITFLRCMRGIEACYRDFQTSRSNNSDQNYLHFFIAIDRAVKCYDELREKVFPDLPKFKRYLNRSYGEIYGVSATKYTPAIPPVDLSA